MPSPDGPEAVHERDILPEVGVQPEARRNGKVCNAEEDDTEDGHDEEEAEQTEETPAEVVDTLAQLEGPERVQDDDEDDEEGEGGVELALDLAAFIEPAVVHVILGVLLLLDADVPLALYALGLLAVFPGLGLELGDAEGEHAEGQKLEGVFQRGAVRDLGEKRVLLAGLFVGGGLKGAQSTLDCAGLAL